jgi:hypothetical protein
MDQVLNEEAINLASTFTTILPVINCEEDAHHFNLNFVFENAFF